MMVFQWANREFAIFHYMLSEFLGLDLVEPTKWAVMGFRLE
jgi:hypothetical protein